MYLHGGMPHLNHEKLYHRYVARNDLIMAKLLHPFWLELAGKLPLGTRSPCRKILAAACSSYRRGKFCMREWMRGMHGMRGLPRPMRGGWQVCVYSIWILRMDTKLSVAACASGVHT